MGARRNGRAGWAVVICLSGMSVWGMTVSRAAAAAPDYTTSVAPILKKYCAGCHNGEDREGKLSLESYEQLQRGGAKGPAVLPGNAESSRLMRLLTGVAKPVMPPEDNPRPTAAEIEVLKNWISARERRIARACWSRRLNRLQECGGRSRRWIVPLMENCWQSPGFARSF